MTQKQMIDSRILGRTIRQARQQKQMTQRVLCDEFISVRTLQKIEKGTVIPTLDVLLHITSKLDMNPMDLLLSAQLPFWLQDQDGVLISLLDQASEDSPLSLVRQRLSERLRMDAGLMAPDLIRDRYVLLLTLMEDADQALNILRQDLTVTPPSDWQVPVVIAYLRLEQDVAMKRRLIRVLRQHKTLLRIPVVAFHLADAYRQDGKPKRALRALNEALKYRPDDQQIRIMPFLYGQKAMNLYALDDAQAMVEAIRGAQLLKELNLLEELKIYQMMCRSAGLLIQFPQIRMEEHNDGNQ